MKSNLRVLCTMLLLAVFGAAWGAKETVTFKEKGYSNQESTTNVFCTNFNLAFDKGTGSTVPAYYDTGTAIRVYGGGTMTISSPYIINKVVLVFGSGEKSNKITTNVGTYSEGTWIGNAQEVVFTVGGSSGHRRIASVTVTYSIPIATINGISPTEIPQLDPVTSFPTQGEFTLDATFANGVTSADYTIAYTSSNENILKVDGYDPGHFSTTPNGGAVGPVDLTVTITPKDTITYVTASKTFAVNITGTISLGELRQITSPGTYTLSFEDDAVVTFVQGDYAYIQDRTGAIVLYNSAHGLTAGQKVSGQATVNYSPVNGNPQITSLEGATLTSGTAPEPKTLDAGSNERYWDFTTVVNRYYKFSEMTIQEEESGEYYIEYGEWGKVYICGKGDATGLSFSDLTRTYDLVGFPTMNNEKHQLTIFVNPATDSTIQQYYLCCNWGNDITEFTYDEENDVYTLTKTVDAGAEFWISDKESDGTFYGASENYESTLSSSNNIVELQADGRNLKSDVSAELVFTLKKTETGLTLTVTGWPTSLRGDLNGDGLVNIMDVNILINIILGKE